MFGNDSLSKKVIDAKHGNVKIQWIIDFWYNYDIIQKKIWTEWMRLG